MGGGRGTGSRLHKAKLVLFAVLVLGGISAFTAHGVWAVFNSETANKTSTFATGTLTLDDTANFASTTLTAGITAGQTSITVASASGFPAAGTYTIKIDSEQLTVTGGQGTTTWTVTRGANGTTAATHSSAATVSTAACSSFGSGSSDNTNSGCDALVAYSAGTENYPGNQATATVRIKDSGSAATGDLGVYMPSCLRGVTADAPWASSTPGAPTFGSASTVGGHLVGGTTYYYELTAWVGGTESVAGGEASYTPPAGTSTNQVTLSWAAVPGATSYEIYRSTSEGDELTLATPAGTGTTYADTSATTPSGSPPSGTGSGNPCTTGSAQLSVQETNSGGTNTQCWYPVTSTNCSFSPVNDLGWFATHDDAPASALDLGAGPAASSTRYFSIGLQFPSAAGDALQGTSATFVLYWYARS